jgi:hypothetical protein
VLSVVIVVVVHRLTGGIRPRRLRQILHHRWVHVKGIQYFALDASVASSLGSFAASRLKRKAEPDDSQPQQRGGLRVIFPQQIGQSPSVAEAN